MLVFHRYHLAATAVLPALFVAHAAWEWSQDTRPAPSETNARPCIQRTTPKPAPKVAQAQERGGLFWRWTYGERRGAATRHMLEDGSTIRLTWAPTPAQMQGHEVYRQHARVHYVFPQLPLLERRGPWGAAEWAFLPREVLQDFGQATVDGDVLISDGVAFMYYHPRHASGGHLYAIDIERGEPLWRAELPREPFQGWYRQSARLHQVDGKILLVLNTTTRAITHTLDPESGRKLSTTRLAPSLSRLSGLRAEAPRAHKRVRADADGSVVYDAASVYLRVSGPSEPARNQAARLDGRVSQYLRAPHDARPAVEYRDQGSLRWRLHLSGQDISNVVTHGGRMFVASSSPNKPGATLTAIDVATGKIVWGGRLHGLGQAKTTQNAVRLHVVDGQVVAHGAESGGSYLEVVDASSGHTVLSKNYPNLR